MSPKEIWAAGLAALIERFGFEVVGQWTDPAAAVMALRLQPPLLIVLDREFAHDFRHGQAGLHACPVVLVFERGRELPRNLLAQLPVRGLLDYEATPTRIESCLRSVSAGSVWIDPAICYVERNQQGPIDWARLTARELEIVNLAASGLSNKQIAEALHLSDGTVKIHMHHVFGKLHLAKRADLYERLFRYGRCKSLNREDIHLPLHALTEE